MESTAFASGTAALQNLIGGNADLVEVERVLDEIGAAGVPQILVFNKLDRLDATQRPRVLADASLRAGGALMPRVFVSASTGEGSTSCGARSRRPSPGARRAVAPRHRRER